MSDIAIRVENLGKRYKLGRAQGPVGYRTLREELLQVPGRLWSALRAKAPDEDEFWALRDLSFEVKQGEVLGVIGRNGAGKSTLLKILSRIVEPTAGLVDLYGRVGSLLEVGTGFHPELTGRENIFLSGAILGMRRAEVRRHFAEIVEFAEVEKFIDTPCKHYSSGMYARLGFAVAACLAADILVVDEVLAVGDASFQRKCLGKMGEVAKNGRTVLFVSHNLTAVRSLCSSVLILEKGRLVANSHDISAMLSTYSATAENGGAVWTATGTEAANQWFALKEIKVTDQAGLVLQGPRHPEDALYIEIAGEVAESNPGLCVGFAVYAEDGSPLWWSYQTDLDERDRPVLGKGPNRLRAQLPGGLLNEGRYRVEFLCGLHFVEWIVGPRTDGPAVEFTIEGFAGNSPFRYSRRPVLLSPVLPWEILPSNPSWTSPDFLNQS